MRSSYSFRPLSGLYYSKLIINKIDNPKSCFRPLSGLYYSKYFPPQAPIEAYSEQGLRGKEIFYLILLDLLAENI